MKKVIYGLLFLIFIIATSVNSQWILQYQLNPGIGLNDIEFINQNTGWICGNPIILKTTNMGLNWITQSHPATDKLIFSIHPVDSNIVYAVGWFETILKTTDGGENWFAIRNGPWGQGHSYKGTFFINSMTGWVIGSGNYIYKTTNGGITFDSLFYVVDPMDIHFKDDNTGLITGGGGLIMKTTNQGINWNIIYMPPNNYGDFRKISVINNQYCFVAEDGKRVYKSTNYGDTWDSIGYVTGADHPYSCRFSSLQTGWVCGTYGEIFKSIDGGATWMFQMVNTTNIGWLRSFWFNNDYTGWSVGNNTKILFTSTGGSTFINGKNEEHVSDYILYQNFPNPFNPSTKIKFEVPRAGLVKISVFDVTGREVAVLVNEALQSGVYETTFDANGGNGIGLTSGVYFCRMEAGGFSETKRMVLVK